MDRVHNRAKAKETPLGLVPDMQDLETGGMNIPKEKLAKLFEINEAPWKDELQDIEKFLNQFGNRMPSEIWQEHKKLAEQLDNNGSEFEDSIRYGDRGGA